MKLYLKNLEQKQNNINNFFQPVLPVSPKEQEVIDWTKFILDKGLPIPIGIVKDDLYQKFKDSDINLSQKTIRNTIFSMVEMVEKRIGTDMNKSGCSSILHDGWTKYGTHYVGIFACDMRKKELFSIIKYRILKSQYLHYFHILLWEK